MWCATVLTAVAAVVLLGSIAAVPAGTRQDASPAPGPTECPAATRPPVEVLAAAGPPLGGVPAAAPVATPAPAAVESEVDALLELATACWATGDPARFLPLHSRRALADVAAAGPPPDTVAQLVSYMLTPAAFERVGQVELLDPDHVRAYVEFTFGGDEFPYRFWFAREDGAWRFDSLFLLGAPPMAIPAATPATPAASPMASPVTSPAASPPAGVSVIPPGETAFGGTHAEWGAAFYRWFFDHPNASAGGDCAQGQAGPVWFLPVVILNAAGTVYSCTIPADRAVLLPLLNASTPSAEDCEATIDQTLAEAGGAEAYFANAAISIDGWPVPDLPLRRIEPAPVPAVGGPGREAGPTPVGGAPAAGWYGCGYFLLLNPLPEGEHTVTFSARAGGGPVEDLTYRLTVVPAGGA